MSFRACYRVRQFVSLVAHDTKMRPSHRSTSGPSFTLLDPLRAGGMTVTSPKSAIAQVPGSVVIK